MSVEVSNVEPKEVWKNFALLNEVPRPSKKEDLVIEFLISFAKKNNLMYKQDKVGNLVIVKESTPDMISHETVVLQSHLYVKKIHLCVSHVHLSFFVVLLFRNLRQ